MPRTARPPPRTAPMAGTAVGKAPALEAELEAALAAEEVLLATLEAPLLSLELAELVTAAPEDVRDIN